MKIFHIAPFGISRSGLYEAARDLARADFLAGHEVKLVDRGFLIDGVEKYADVGSVDDRAGFKLTTASIKELDTADVIIDHCGIPLDWVARNQVPIIFIVHGRPLDSFRVEQGSSNQTSFSYMSNIASWPRVKKMVYFWPEYEPFWSIFPKEKSAVFEYPAMDELRFNPDGIKHIIEDKHRGDFNILICDSWGRKDVDMFEIINGIIQAGKEIKNFKLHFYGVSTPIQPCWDVLYKEMYKLNCMGELCGRMLDMDQIYRGMDCVLTPHRIITRVVGEALLTGIPVIASEGCSVAQFLCDPHDPLSVANAIKQFINSDQKVNRENALRESKKFHLANYSKEMGKIYKEIMENKQIIN